MPIIAKEDLASFAADLLSAAGFNANEAEETSQLLVWADLRGVESHGVLRIPRYIDMVEAGTICPGVAPQLVRNVGATCVMDFGKAPGAVAMAIAAEKASELANQFGIGWCSARAISHAGAIGYFTTRLAMRGLIGIAATASSPLMTYHGARGQALSTSPLSIAVPRHRKSDQPILLDMSTAAAAYGKILSARQAGTSIPSGWGVDHDGLSTEDPNKVSSLLPMAGPKGSGLSLMIEILAGILVNNGIIVEVLQGHSKDGFNGLVLAVDPSAFGDPEVFLTSTEALATEIHKLDAAPGFEKVQLPGERGFDLERQRSAAGIPLARPTLQALIDSAKRLGVPIPKLFSDNRPTD